MALKPGEYIDRIWKTSGQLFLNIGITESELRAISAREKPLFEKRNITPEAITRAVSKGEAVFNEWYMGVLNAYESEAHTTEEKTKWAQMMHDIQGFARAMAGSNELMQSTFQNQPDVFIEFLVADSFLIRAPERNANWPPQKMESWNRMKQKRWDTILNELGVSLAPSTEIKR